MTDQTREQKEADKRLIEEMQVRLEFAEKEIVSNTKTLDDMTVILVQRLQLSEQGASIMFAPAMNGKEVNHEN